MGIMPCVYFFPPLELLINHYKLDWKFQDFPLFPLIFSVFEKIVTKEWQWRGKVDLGNDSQDPSGPKNQGLTDGRNIED